MRRANATRTTCPYCGVGCGILASAAEGGGIVVAGDEEHPANHGRLCSKGAALAETLSLEGRLLHPELHGRCVDWDTALAEVAGGIGRAIGEHGADSVGFYVSGQLLTEDYYVANKLMKGFLGSANIDTNSRLCMASSVAGHRRAFGADTVPGTYEDLELANVVVLVGSNLAWCHPVLYQRLAAAKARRPELTVVNIDPRRTASCDIADLHLAIRPGTDVLLFNGLLVALVDAGKAKPGFLTAVAGYEEALAVARASASNAALVAESCGLREAELHCFYSMFAATDRVVTVYSQGVNQSSSGSDKVNAIINCHLLTGRIGTPGSGPFSVTGQPNAMGGREVGALANQLAAHMDFEPEQVERVRRFWKAPAIALKPGLKAAEMFDAVATGRIKVLWIMATNPAVSMPDSDSVRRALAGCELVVVSDCMRRTDTASYAHVLLPALAWGEKDGTVTNSERRISRQRTFMPAPGEARPDWWIIAEVARRLGFAESFAYRSPAEVFREHAALSAFENAGSRDFDLGALASLDDAGYARLEPVRWPVPAEPERRRERFFADGRFYTEDGRARLVPTPPVPPRHEPDAAFPLALNTGRIRDQWHTMTRTGRSPRLSRHAPGPIVDVHASDAAAAGIASGDLARIESRWGRCSARVRIDPGQRPGVIFAPMHWTDQFSREGCVNAAVNPVYDPVSGQPELKHTPVRLSRFPARWQAILLALEPLDASPHEYAVITAREGFWRHELAGSTAPAEGWALLTGILRSKGGGEWIEYNDAGAGQHRGASIQEGRLAACAFLAPDSFLPDEDWLATMFEAPSLEATDRRFLLAARPASPGADTGPTICACFAVGRETILRAAATGGFNTTEAVGRALGAGTSCGSCLPEIRGLLASLGNAAPA
ncbi:MAG: molybdopterin-dependent oxidoreductase [Proteobacteria bacterium]|nr:molybdopterin-dependent oxidoreductase [Pseudomonadota bacterium]MBI3500141.1 molybdopterin-dependent oxidoreductase [Pseudomonadota bacterium]